MLKIDHLGCGYLNSVSVSPDGSLHTSGGKDCKAFLWGLNEGKHLHTLEHQRDLILAGPIQSVRRLRLVDQDLDSCLQDHARGAEAVEGRPATVPVAGLVHRRTDPVRRLLRQHHPRLAGVRVGSLRSIRVCAVCFFTRKKYIN